MKGKFDYRETFETFLKSTTQKQDTADVLKIFAAQLHEYIFPDNRFVNIADLGCADGTSCIRYLNAMNPHASYHYVGIDINEKYINYDAPEVLSQNSMIKSFQLINADIFSGQLAERTELSEIKFDLIFVSHAAYHINDPLKCGSLLNDLANILAPTGIAILLHETAFKDQIQYYRSKYGNFPAFDIASELKNTANKMLENPFECLQFMSTLKFTSISNNLWESIKNPGEYVKYKNIPGFIENLEKLAFIVQRDFTDMIEDEKLVKYIDEIKAAIIPDNKLSEPTQLQIVASKDCKIVPEIHKAIENLKYEINQNFNGVNTKIRLIT